MVETDTPDSCDHPETVRELVKQAISLYGAQARRRSADPSLDAVFESAVSSHRDAEQPLSETDIEFARGVAENIISAVDTPDTDAELEQATLASVTS
jgi:hypothetical protein